MQPKREERLTLAHRDEHTPVMVFDDYGAVDAPRCIVCLHGLSRNAQDFTELAEHLAARGARVICPDIVGRGRSDRLPDPEDYTVPIYAQHVLALLNHLGRDKVDIVGTSMGGLIGMALAALEEPRIDHLVVNDVGPFIPKEALQQISQYLGMDPHFPDMAAAEGYFRTVYGHTGDLSDAQWRAMTTASVRPDDERGGYRLRYDAQIAEAFRSEQHDDVDVWDVYDRIKRPILLLRGENSPLLLPETAQTMTERGPRAELVVIPGVGHAPALKSPLELTAISNWLGL